MKASISIPDRLFNAAEQIAEQLAISRSELYTRAVAEFVSAHSQEAVTAKLNAVYGSETAELDPILAKLQQSALHKFPW